MTPEQVSMLTATAAILERVGTWPIGSIIAAIVLCPWIVLLIVSRSMEKRYAAAEEHRNAVVRMYESNVRLVERYEKIAGEQVDTIRLSTSATVELTTYLHGRVPCFQRMEERKGKILG